MDGLVIRQPSRNSVILFLFTFVFIFVRAFDEYTQVITRFVIPAIGVIAISRGGGTRFLRNQEVRPYLYLFLWSVATFFIPSSFENFIRYSQLFIGVIILTIIMEVYLRNERDFFTLLLAVVLGVLAIVIQAQLTGGLSTSLSFEGSYERAEGIADNPNTFGALLLMASMGSTVLYLRSRITILIYIFLTIVFAFAILQTASRSAFLGWTIIFGYTIYQAFKRWDTNVKIIVFTFLLLTLVLGLGLLVDVFSNFLDNTLLGFRLQRETSRSDELRSGLIYIGIKMIIENPIFGVGSGNFTNSNEFGLYSHNDFIEVFATLGVVGFSFYVLFLRKCYLLFKRLSRLKNQHSWLGKMGLLLLFTFVVQGLFKPLFIDVLWLFLLVAFLIAARNKYQESIT